MCPERSSHGGSPLHTCISARSSNQSYSTKLKLNSRWRSCTHSRFTYLILVYLLEAKFLCPNGFSFIGGREQKIFHVQESKKSLNAREQCLEVTLPKKKKETAINTQVIKVTQGKIGLLYSLLYQSLYIGWQCCTSVQKSKKHVVTRSSGRSGV